LLARDQTLEIELYKKRNVLLEGKSTI